MALDAEDNSTRRAPSNPSSRNSWSLLGRACRQAADTLDVGAALQTVLRTALEATVAERAFLVSSSEPSDPSRRRIEASLSLRGDGKESPSRTVLKWAFLDPRPRAGLGILEDRKVLEEASVRSLGLRHVMVAPVPSSTRELRIVIDSRAAPGLPASELSDLLQALAALVALILTRSRRPDPDPGAPRARPEPDALVGRSAAFVELLSQVRRVAPWRLPVLIFGESGSGKEGIARAIHLESPRRHGPFVPVNCAAIPDSLLESELFGAVRGAYTGSDHDRPGLFRAAHGGTLFLDEVGDMPHPMQAKLLRTLQDSRVRPVGGRSDVTVDVRIITATHRDLSRLVADGTFRQDLYYRLAVVDLRVPPLRERLEDIPLLVEHLRSRLEADTGLGSLRLTERALESLRSHSWPGNVRELEAVLARALLRCPNGEISARHLRILSAPLDEAMATSPQPPTLERSMLEAALLRTAGNITEAAALVGWSRPKLYRRMALLGVERPRSSRSRGQR